MIEVICIIFVNSTIVWEIKFQGKPVNIKQRIISKDVQKIEKKIMLIIKVSLNLKFKKLTSPIKIDKKQDKPIKKNGIKYIKKSDLTTKELKIQYRPKAKKDNPKNHPFKKDSLD